MEENQLQEPLPWDKPSFLSVEKIIGTIASSEDEEGNQEEAQILKLSSDDDSSTKYYFLERKLNETGFASVHVGFAVEPKSDNNEYQIIKSSSTVTPYTFEMVAIKLFDRENMDLAEVAKKTAALPSAMTEMAALEMISKQNEGDSHVDYCTSIGSDKDTYYAIVPFHGEGTLFQYVAESGALAEPIARHCFRQILKGIQTFRDIGLCHRNINLSTIQLRGDSCSITELSSCMKFSGELFPPHWAQGGNPRYIPPEVVRMENFNGEQADLWAAAICLCQMLWGMEAPFVWASPADPRYKELCINGNAASGATSCSTPTASSGSSGIQQWTKQQRRRSSLTQPKNNKGIDENKMDDDDTTINISKEACDLIQKMLRANPNDRFTLEQILSHEWVTTGETTAPQFSSDRKSVV